MTAPNIRPAATYQDHIRMGLNRSLDRMKNISNVLIGSLDEQDIQRTAMNLWENVINTYWQPREVVTLLVDIAPEDRLYLRNEVYRKVREIEATNRTKIDLKLSADISQTIHSSQISLTGPPDGVKDAYLAVRNLLPITVWFDLKLNPALQSMILDPGSKALLDMQKKYQISLCVVPVQSHLVHPTPSNHISIYIRTQRSNESNLKNSIEDLTTFIESNKFGHIYPTLQTKIDIPSNQQITMGRSFSIMDNIASRTSTQIHVNRSPSNMMANVSIVGGSFTAISSARTDISDRFVVELNFDLNIDEESYPAFMDNLGRHLERIGEDTGTHILMKPNHMTPNHRTMVIKGSDKEFDKIFEVRDAIIKLMASPPMPAVTTPVTAAATHTAIFGGVPQMSFWNR